MTGASLIPVDAPGEHDDVADLLSIARVTWNRGDHEAAVNFVQRAAQTAMELDLDLRGMELAKIAAELKASVSQPPAAPARPAPPTASQKPQFVSATQTPPLELTPARPPHQTLPGINEGADRPAQPPPQPELMEDEPATIPLPMAQPPAAAQMLTLSSTDLQEVPQRDTSIDPPPAHAVQPPVRTSAVPIPAGAMMSPRPPTVTPSVVPRPGAASTTTSAAPRARTSGTPPPLPSHRPHGAAPVASAAPAAPATSVAPVVAKSPSNGAPRVSASPSPPKVATSARPSTTSAAPSTTPSRAPLPLRVRSNEPELPKANDPSLTPAMPTAIAPSVEPNAVRRSAPWVDEVVAPIAAEGGAPVVVGVRARVHFHTDGTLELGPDGQGAGGLPIIILPQKGEDMTTLLKRLTARKK